MNTRLRFAPSRLVVLAIVACAAGLGVVGCNTILDNRPGSLAQAKSNAANPTEPPSAETNTGSNVAPGSDTDGSDTSPAPTSTCPDGQQRCNGQCVDTQDPTYGCGDPSCAPCPGAHGTATCQGNACTMLACDQGYADCNHQASDGCEADLSKRTTCGSCNTTCPVNTPACAPAGPSFQCATGCPLTAPLLCENECVSPVSSVNHCGGCNAKCPDIEHAEVTCGMGKCGFTCKPSYHACAGKCVVETDATACGATCMACPPAANATPTCQLNACGFTCNPGFGNCNTTPGDGCEVNLLGNDPLNCGACGRSCNGGACTAGVCGPPPPPDAGL